MRRSAIQALQILAEHQRSRLWAWSAGHAALSVQIPDHVYSPPSQWTFNWTRPLQTITDINASREGSSAAVFDGSLKALHRNRVAFAARKQLDHQASATTEHDNYVKDPLLGGIADRLVDRLLDCKSRTFGNVLIVGGAVVQVLERVVRMNTGVQHVTVVDTSSDMLQYVQDYVAAKRQSDTQGASWPSVTCVTIDPNEELLQVEPGTFDLAISCLGLHWFNDLPTMMAQCRFALKDDGLFLGALFAGETLQVIVCHRLPLTQPVLRLEGTVAALICMGGWAKLEGAVDQFSTALCMYTVGVTDMPVEQELRISCACAQQERHGGLSPIVSPFARARDGGNLLTRAGLALPAVDMDQFVVKYAAGPTAVISHLRQMGEMNAVLQRQPILSRDTALAAAAVYQAMFGDADGSVPATFEVMFLTGWAPHASQQTPAKRGSATVSFHELAEGLVESGQAQGGSTGEADPEQCDVTLSTIQDNPNENDNSTKQ